MNSKTRSFIREIQMKLKNTYTAKSVFPNEDDVIMYAVAKFYDELKTKRLL